MSKINKDALEKLPFLSRINCSKEEMEELLDKILSVLKYVEQIDEIDVEGIPPCNHVLEHISNVFREDEVGKIEKNERLSQEKFLKNSPSNVGGMIKVPPVIKF